MEHWSQIDMRVNTRHTYVRRTSLLVDRLFQKPCSAAFQIEAKMMMALGILSEKTSSVKLSRPDFVMKFRKKARFSLVFHKIPLAAGKGLLDDRLFPKFSLRRFFFRQ